MPATGGTEERGRALVVDDEPQVLRAFRRTLEKAGFEVDGAATGADAVACFRRDPPDVVVTDISMPGMDGFELIRAIRDTSLDCPVILVTGAPDVASAIRAIEYGAYRYLVKPVENAELVRVVEKAVRIHRLATLKRQAMAELGAGDRQVGDRAGLEAHFSRALDSLYMVYQPVVSYEAQSIFGYEGYVRSREPKFPHPGALFHAAERLGRLHELGRAIRRIAPEPLMGVDDPVLFLNVHPGDLADEALYDAALPLSRIAERVFVEVTERASLHSVANISARIATLRERGYRVALDDLGAGYAGLSSFSLLDPEMVKLDTSLVRDIDKSSIKRKLVEGIISVCRDLGTLVVAEGVETRAERDVLLERGCDLFQGFLFARPGAPFPVVSW